MWPAPDPVLVPVAVAALGWVWGSFLNQLVDRAPRRSARGEPAAEPPWPEGAPTLRHPPRSVCLACRASIPWFENIPVFSYLALRGRCRRCGAAIGARTLLMEVATPLGFLALLLLAPGRAGVGVAFPWGYLLLSWALVALPLLLERRRFSAWFLAAGGCCAVAALFWRL